MPLSTFDKFLERTSLILLIAILIFACYAYSTFPDIIPVHFNAAGNPDRYGNKSTFIILPIITTIIFLFIRILSKRPHILNYMREITPENALRQYSTAARMLRFLNLAVLIIFGSIMVFTYLTVAGITTGLGIWFLPVMIFIMFIISLALMILPYRK